MTRTAVLSRLLLAFGILALLGRAGPLRADDKQALEIHDKLAKTIKFNGIDDPKTNLGEVLDMLAKQYDLTFTVNERAFTRQKITDVLKFEIAGTSPLHAMNTSLETVLKQVLSRIGEEATFVIRKDYVEITTSQAVVQEFYPGFRGGKLPPLIHAAFEEKPLDDALKQLARMTGENVVIDSRVAKEAKMVVSATMTNVPLDTAVRLLADMAALTTIRVENVLYVTSKDNARLMQREIEDRRMNEPRRPIGEGLLSPYGKDK
jgi:hypothetical protein